MCTLRHETCKTIDTSQTYIIILIEECKNSGASRTHILIVVFLLFLYNSSSLHVTLMSRHVLIWSFLDVILSMFWYEALLMWSCHMFWFEAHWMWRCVDPMGSWPYTYVKDLHLCHRPTPMSYTTGAVEKAWNWRWKLNTQKGCILYLQM